MIGRFVDVTASPAAGGGVLPGRRRALPILGETAVITDPIHVALAQEMRRDLARDAHRRSAGHPGIPGNRGSRQHTDGHVVELRALPDYDALFGVDFATTATAVTADVLAADSGAEPRERKTRP